MELEEGGQRYQLPVTRSAGDVTYNITGKLLRIHPESPSQEKIFFLFL